MDSILYSITELNAPKITSDLIFYISLFSLNRSIQYAACVSVLLMRICMVVLTGGTDRKIRLWDINNPSCSSCLVSPCSRTEKLTVDYK